jgi:hypothetical protein
MLSSLLPFLLSSRLLPFSFSSSNMPKKWQQAARTHIARLVISEAEGHPDSRQEEVVAEESWQNIFIGCLLLVPRV